MSAPILPIDPGNLTSLTNLGIVGAWMLFPDDKNCRDRYIRTAAVHEHLERPSGATVSREYFDAVVSLALGAASPDEIASEWEKRSPRGYGAGVIVYNAMKQIQLNLPGKAPIGTATKAVGAAIWGRQASASKHVNKAVIETYRPVAALWAAFVHLEDGDEALLFPCRPEDLPNFLDLAESFRAMAEETTPPHGRQPIIPPGVSVRIPDSVLAVLPKGTLTTVPK